MSERSIIDQLDDAVATIIAGRAVDTTTVEPEVAQLAEVARDLSGLPSERFKVELREQLIRRDSMSSPALKTEAMSVRRLSFYICVRNASAAIDFYREAFGAKELMRLAEPTGKIGHAELEIGNATLKLSDEYPDYGVLSPETIGGSPVKLHLDVDDVDEFARRAIAAGATLNRPIEDQFYGDRSGQLADPFGYTWIVSTHQKDVSLDDMQKQFDAFAQQESGSGTITEEAPKEPLAKHKREGFHSVTPYLTVEQAPELIDFLKQAFGATESFRTTGSAGGMHAEVKIGDSMLMIGGGAGIAPRPAAIHLYVPDIDDAYQRALTAGATSLMEPQDQPYGERAAAVQDFTGNRWYIATTFVPLKEIAEDLHTVAVYFHPIGAPRFIEFLENAFGAEEIMRADSEDGGVRHAKVRIGDSIVEMGEAQAAWQPMPTAIYLYVENVDAIYEQALKAGATSLLPPADQPYGDRNAWVTDPFDNVWYLATYLG
jgi:PhnB protein